MRSKRNAALRRWTGIVLSGVSLVWLAFLLWQELPEVSLALRDANVGWVLASLALLAASLIPSVFTLAWVLEGNKVDVLNWRQMTRLHFASQVVRYLPGRFWGIAYSVNEARPAVTSPVMLRANIDFMAIALGVNLTAGLFLWAMSSERTLLGVVLLGLGVCTVVATLTRNWIGGSLRLIRKVLPSRAEAFTTAMSGTEGYEMSTVTRILILKSFTWSLYVLAWVALGNAFPVLEGSNMVLLCGVYTVAWVVGFVTLITPGGLGIRELVFYALVPAQADQAAIAFVAIFVRVWLMLSEMLLGVVALSLFRRDRIEA